MVPVKKRMRVDHDEDLHLFDLSSQFHSFCSSSSRVSLDDLIEQLNTHDLHYRSSIELNCQTIQQEILTNEEKLHRLNQSIEQLKQSLIERKRHWKYSKLQRRHQADYATMSNVIHRLPTRENLQKKYQQLNQEYEQQKSELNHLNQRLIIYQKQSKVVLYSLLELVGFIDVKLPINFEDEIGRLDNNSFLEMKDDK